MDRASKELREVRLPGCKSLSARVLVLAACASGSSTLRGLSSSEDTLALTRALRALGAEVSGGPGPAPVTVRGWGGAPRAQGVELDAGEAGTNLRFLAALAAAGESDVLLCGAPQLWKRPHGALFELLRQLGARVEEGARSAAGRPAVHIRSRGLPGGRWEVPVRDSSQYLSGLLLASAWSAPVTLGWRGDLPSAGYLDLTVDAVRAFRGAAAVTWGDSCLRAAPGSDGPLDFEVPGDPSAATFFLVALILSGAAARIREPWSETHPEARLFDGLFAAGLLRREGAQLSACEAVPERPLEFDLQGAPDAGPALAVLGAGMPCGVVLHNAGRLRLKESDRVAGIERLLAQLGAPFEIAGDTISVRAAARPRASRPEPYDPAGDHRLAMAAAVAGLPVSDRGCVAKSFPGFWEEWERWTS